MKRILCLLILIAALPWAAAAGGAPALLEGESLLVALEGFESAEGEAVLLVACRNDSDEEVTLTLIEPEVNGEPAGFRYGWGGDELTLPARADSSAEIVLQPDSAREVPQRVSLRFVMDGRISSRGTVDSQEDLRVETASFELGAQEPQMLETAVSAPADADGYRRVYSDSAPGRDAPLEYARALICLRAAEDGGGLLTHLCTVEAVVDEEGTASASYSGLALALDGDGAFPLRTFEHADGTAFADAGPLELSGPGVFYAVMDFSLLWTEAGWATSNALVESSELGGPCSVVPCALFDSVQCARDIWRPVLEGGEADLALEGNASWRAGAGQPLRLGLVPAEELGEIAVCFEYCYADGHAVIHLPAGAEELPDVPAGP